jgi:hypothetical protein
MTEASDPTAGRWPFDPEEFWKAHSTEELFANAKPLRADESFVIEDLTDEESEAGILGRPQRVTLRRLLFDTNVRGAGLDRRTEPLRNRYARHFVDTESAIAAQTVAELRFGALAANWGPKRMAALMAN